MATPSSATTTPNQRRAFRVSLSTSADMAMVMAGLSAMINAARLAGSLANAPMKNRLYENTPNSPSTNVAAHWRPLSRGSPPSSTNAAISSATQATT
jgi:hypothetical protein